MEEIKKNTTLQDNTNIYLKNITIENYGSITNINYKCPFDENGNPIPIVLVGKNGSGKTLFLSNILHSLIEIKRQFYTEIPEVDKNNYYRISSQDYIQENKDFSYINLEYSCNMHHTCATVRNVETFNFETLKKYKYIDLNHDGFRKTGHFDHPNKCNEETFNKNLFLYFPVDRYYHPKWLNIENKNLSFLITENFLGKTKKDIIKDNLLEDIESWILDVIIDKYIYEQATLSFKQNAFIREIITYSGKNTIIQDLINKIIRKIFPDCEEYNSARIGISAKQNRRISIMAKDKNGNDIELCPTFKNLSSGEIMILALFCSIIKEADKIFKNSLNLNEITGIVLIDEIDNHLHSNFAKEILPEVMSLFPKIQFIVSSHSPFYLLGMKQKFDNNCSFLTMPDGNIMSDVENFEEIQKCYEMLDLNHNKLLNTLKSANEKISTLEKPLILTEGKTDWKHIKSALSFYQTEGKYKDLDIDFWEYEEEFGNSKLETLLENLSKIKNKHKIIGIFDSDDKTGEKYLNFKDFGNNVFGICIPQSIDFPDKGISIEFLYKSKDIIKCDSEGRRLYLSNEFFRNSRRLKTDTNISTTNNKVESFYKSNTIKIIDECVFDLKENSIALSKNNFAMKILNKEKPFDIMDFSGFIPLLDNIEKIIKNNNIKTNKK